MDRVRLNSQSYRVYLTKCRLHLNEYDSDSLSINIIDAWNRKLHRAKWATKTSQSGFSLQPFIE
ncbi:hypothetical protein QTP88_003453 [Uroleucon formosanum]